MLKPGDPCPCCGQPIKTSDPEILSILTYIKETNVNLEAYLKFVRFFGRGNGKMLPLEIEDDLCIPT